MLRLAHGHWARWPDGIQPFELGHWEKAALLQRSLGPNIAVSHLSAGKLWGLPLSTGMTWVHGLLGEPPATPRHDLRPHLAFASGRRNQDAGGYVLHRGLGLEPVQGLWGCDVTSALETLLALQPVLPGWRGVTVVDFLLAHGLSMGRREPLTTARFGELLEQVPAGTPGLRSVKRALTRASERMWSPMETVLRLLVEDAGFPRPLGNVEVMLPDRSAAYIDLAWPEQMVGLEYNGSVHYQNAQAYDEEMHRLNQLEECGWAVRTVVVNDLKLPTRLSSMFAWLDLHLKRR
ncbi:hypothetical protein FCK90_14270 [Kocuria coralli]|uniref:DUF559 domain-containing protein n=1 Tax=Kocuria coralli TaxID=1461025 RepID=A0A5J5KUY2_9MICC|nr:hypothetical protein [Kocuria coralli]KAA9393030.1 hypothetical protein FCK90_14270 [Kocuria coralli]